MSKETINIHESLATLSERLLELCVIAGNINAKVVEIENKLTDIVVASKNVYYTSELMGKDK